MAQFQESDQRESGLQAARPHTARKNTQNVKLQSDWLALRNFYESVYVSFYQFPRKQFTKLEINKQLILKLDLPGLWQNFEKCSITLAHQ